MVRPWGSNTDGLSVTNTRARMRLSPHWMEHAIEDVLDVLQLFVEAAGALVPQRKVLHRGVRVAAQQPREADNLLAAKRVALVRHRRRAFLPLRERFLDLADLGLLQPANLERELLERSRRDRQRREQLGMPVALNHLRRHRRGLEAESPADIFFNLRRQVREGADGTR